MPIIFIHNGFILPSLGSFGKLKSTDLAIDAILLKIIFFNLNYIKLIRKLMIDISPRAKNIIQHISMMIIEIIKGANDRRRESFLSKSK
ncbi:MAG: hypothetical protein COU22_00905 [Candidatus Komeilibacteria bacterium CG10_big_fil_rev_8_21_14_0_10_41_13]|uniref:Uncharacterized protein n=1 Tax=Candidatus Komeilibacteria bacterium CG10_big_fil_rev_8_21_14_0_10_41_13 TaxID=1974476 RepID=A0A2M6WD12_9BACT|nr:MAG: hypothetical protein COU22_00905 [Candidatus Komeilibacteria bacterium CG10_big_fil_rev_8_21_14_0_10_41_13]